jgi:hypothetical protein
VRCPYVRVKSLRGKNSAATNAATTCRQVSVIAPTKNAEDTDRASPAVSRKSTKRPVGLCGGLRRSSLVEPDFHAANGRPRRLGGEVLRATDGGLHR